MSVRIQLRRGTATQWTSANPTLLVGEVGVEIDTGRMKAGNGSQSWTSLPYASGGAAPDLSGYATTAALAATQAQQTQLMTVTPTVDELAQSILITSWVVAGAASTYMNATSVVSIWAVPFPCRVVAATLVYEYFNLAANDTNYLTLSLRRRRGPAYDTIVSKNTKVAGGEAVAARVPWSFANAVWDTGFSVLDSGDVLSFQVSYSGSPGNMNLPLGITFRYVPL